MVYNPDKYRMPECPHCGFIAYPNAEPEPSDLGPRALCDRCGERFTWHVSSKFTSTCDACEITGLTALLQPSQDDDGRVAPECPSDECDGYMRSNYKPNRTRGPKSGVINYQSKGLGAIELPLNTTGESLNQRERELPPPDLPRSKREYGYRLNENWPQSGDIDSLQERKEAIYRILNGGLRRRDH